MVAIFPCQSLLLSTIVLVLNNCILHTYVNICVVFFIKILITYAFIVVQDPVDTTVCQGDNAAFTCVVFIQSGGVVVPSWFRDGVMVNPTSHTITTNRTDNTIAPAYISSTVTVSSVTTLDDGAMFNCDILSLVVSNTSALRVVGKCIPISNVYSLVHISICDW